jgi:hypothetical protein
MHIKGTIKCPNAVFMKVVEEFIGVDPLGSFTLAEGVHYVDIDCRHYYEGGDSTQDTIDRALKFFRTEIAYWTHVFEK